MLLNPASHWEPAHYGGLTPDRPTVLGQHYFANTARDLWTHPETSPPPVLPVPAVYTGSYPAPGSMTTEGFSAIVVRCPIPLTCRDVAGQHGGMPPVNPDCPKNVGGEQGPHGKLP